LIDYVVEDEKFTKTVVTEKVDTGKYPKGTLFTFMEINYDKDGEVNATHNEELDEKSQTLYPIEEEKPEVPTKPNETQSSSVTSLEPSSSIVTAEKNLPQTGEKMSPLLIVIGAILILVVIIIIFIHYSSKDS